MTVRVGSSSSSSANWAGARYEVLGRAARQVDLPWPGELGRKLERGAMDVISFAGKPGDFRMVALQRSGQLSARLIFAPLEKADAEGAALDAAGPEIRLLPVSSKGRHWGARGACRIA